MDYVFVNSISVNLLWIPSLIFFWFQVLQMANTFVFIFNISSFRVKTKMIICVCVCFLFTLTYFAPRGHFYFYELWRIEAVILFSICIPQHAPGVPKILVGNRLHLAFRRQISEACAEQYAEKNNMAFFEVSPLCDFNVTESFAELSRLALKRNGMSRAFGFNRGESHFVL